MNIKTLSELKCKPCSGETKNLSKDEININTQNPEFLDWKWIKSSELPTVAVNFKVDLYKRLNKELDYLKLP